MDGRLLAVVRTCCELCPYPVLAACLTDRLQAQYGSSGFGVDHMIRELPGDIPALMDVVLERVER